MKIWCIVWEDAFAECHITKDRIPELGLVINRNYGVILHEDGKRLILATGDGAEESEYDIVAIPTTNILKRVLIGEVE
jgi:hypothetical protein